MNACPGAAAPGVALGGLRRRRVDTAFLVHSYIANARALIADLKSLLETGRAPDGRTGVEPVMEAAGATGG
ncbi:MAG: hypothetical protein ACM3N6_00085 [Betaproteobacteria bacterium]